MNGKEKRERIERIKEEWAEEVRKLPEKTNHNMLDGTPRDKRGELERKYAKKILEIQEGKR